MYINSTILLMYLQIMFFEYYLGVLCIHGWQCCFCVIEVCYHVYVSVTALNCVQNVCLDLYHMRSEVSKVVLVKISSLLGCDIVVGRVVTDILGNCCAFIFRVEHSRKKTS
jgi:hypothetical protein